MSDNKKLWNSLKRPPPTALRAITGGRLKGKSDINPQWRIEAMTELFGPIGFGWTFDIVKEWLEPGHNNEVAAFVSIKMKVKVDGEWSEPIPGMGGSMFVAQEKNGLYTSDEAYKMALTDALSVAMKQLGVAADIYAGLWDGSKYVEREQEKKPVQKPDSAAISEEVNSLIKDIQLTPDKSAFDAIWLGAQDLRGRVKAFADKAVAKALWDAINDAANKQITSFKEAQQ
jgi:uncharacterized short protein YbdD (DUF466 family)